MWKRLVLAGSIALPLFAATVSRVGIVAKPRAYRGPCPATIQFIATIHVNHPSRVEYQWIRSDGAEGPRRIIDIRSAGQGVTDAWTLGRGHETMRIWEQLRVIAPTGIRSPKEAVEVRCR